MAFEEEKKLKQMLAAQSKAAAIAQPEDEIRSLDDLSRKRQRQTSM